jgi:hypothetical protein
MGRSTIGDIERAEIRGAELDGRICVSCGHTFQASHTAVIARMVAGGPVFRHTTCEPLELAPASAPARRSACPACHGTGTDRRAR